MKKTLILIVIILTSNLVDAQFIKEKAINAQIGFALSTPKNSLGYVVNSGFFAQAEFVLKIASWLEMRPYAGFISIKSNGKDLRNINTSEKAESNAFLLGGKVRVRAPLPWVAPYLEIGIGGSIGEFETIATPYKIDKNGIIYQIPISIGLELGRNNNFALGFTYFLQSFVEQHAAAFAIGITFPLNK